MKRDRRPRLAISCNIDAADPTRARYRGKALDYGDASLSAAVARAGALPYLIPALADEAALAAIIDDVDGLVLSGGDDISPRTLGITPLNPSWPSAPERDRYELCMVREALARGRPILAICRGVQLLNVALGGTLYQDLPTQRPGPVVHRDGDRYDAVGHRVALREGSWLARVHAAHLRDGAILVNSVHHQGLDAVGEGLLVTATADDGLVEGVEVVDAEQFAVGVQWHPEWLVPTGPAAAQRVPGDLLFAAFVDVAARRRSGR